MDLREQAEDILDVLEDLADPDGIAELVLEWEVLPTLDELDPRMALARAPHSFAGDVATNRLNTVLKQRHGELTGATTKVEHTGSGVHPSKEEVATEHEVLRPSLPTLRPPRSVRSRPDGAALRTRRGPKSPPALSSRRIVKSTKTDQRSR